MRITLRLLVALLAALAWGSIASAQSTIVNPTSLEFQASPDHSGKWLDGSDKVTEYRVEYFLDATDPTTGTPAGTVSLGKPTPDASGKVSVSQAGLFASLSMAGVVYKATVLTVGPSGSSRSVASGPFGFETRVAPSPASAVVLR